METDRTELNEKIEALRKSYASGATRDTAMRIESLKRLRQAIERNFDAITEALHSDLHKSASESYMSEISIVLNEIDDHIRHLRKWCRPQRHRSNIAVFPSRSQVITEPLGTVLIMAPWNYPFNLTLDPLVGAVAAGNTVAIKPSQTSSTTGAIITRIVGEAFADNHVAVLNLDHQATAALIEQKFDHIFFTGNASFGREVMIAAARNLTPVTLELGGKSPCIVDRTANLRLAARRIAWGKTFNAGQTCIAPDYLLVERSVKGQLIGELKKALNEFYGADARLSTDYPRIISTRAFDRLTALLQGADIVGGGATDRDELYIEPTIIDNVTPQSAIMEEEIFGPLIPIVAFDDLDRATEYINSRPKPLALYYFGDNRTARRVLHQTSSGGACVNDVIMHIANPHLPFGGVGRSGTGRYHSRESIATFSNRRAVLWSPATIDIPLRYPPYRTVKLLKRFI